MRFGQQLPGNCVNLLHDFERAFVFNLDSFLADVSMGVKEALQLINAWELVGVFIHVIIFVFAVCGEVQNKRGGFVSTAISPVLLCFNSITLLQLIIKPNFVLPSFAAVVAWILEA